MAMRSTGNKNDPGRHALLRDYRLKSVQFTRLLDGKKYPCCGCDQSVGTDFYMFEATNRASGAKSFLHAGETCAKTLMQYSRATDAPIQALPYFNPFVTPSGKSRASGAGGVGTNAAWTPLNRELFHAINLTFMAMNLKPGSALSDVLDTITENPSRQRPTTAPALNTIIGRNLDKTHFSLTDYVNDLRAGNPTMKQYPFTLIREALAKLSTPPTVYL